MMPSEKSDSQENKGHQNLPRLLEGLAGLTTDGREKIGGFDGTVGQTNLAQREI